MDYATACEDCLSRLAGADIQSLYERWVPHDEWDVSVARLAHEAEAGCPICKIHYKAVTESTETAPNHEDSAAPRENSNHGDTEAVISSQWLAKGDTAEDLSDLTRLVISGHAFDIFADPDNISASFVSNRRQRPAKDSTSSFDTFQRWIDDCLQGHHRDHTVCGAFDGAELPPRVIQIVQDADGTFAARLVDCAGLTDRYAALSYCWGPPSCQSLTTTIANFQEHLLSLPLDKTSQTLRDAVVTCQRLGVKYLWVDALCIIQDSDADKDFQISKMKAIFENAFVTIVAAGGADASCGFLSMPAANRQVAFTLPYHHPSMATDEEGTICLTPAEDKAMSMEPINMRAWTLEERLLSRRKLIFFSDRVAWECDNVSLADGGEITNMGDDMRLPLRILRPGPNAVFTAEELNWAVHTEWTKNVEWYTMRELTRPADKLRAIGGIAEKYHTVLRTHYLGGLWRDYLHPGLLWRRIVDVESGQLFQRPLKYRAPSWSWAAVDGIVEYLWLDREQGSLEVARFGHDKSIATLTKPTFHESKIELSSAQRSFGGVTGGSIRLEGLVQDVKVNLVAATYGEFGRTLQASLSSDASPTPSKIDEYFLECWPDAWGDMAEGAAELCLLCLTGAAEDTAANAMYSAKTTFVIRGLVLARIGQKCFSRIGFFELWDYDYRRLMGGWQTRCIVLV